MSDLKNFVRDLGYFGVGAAAALVEVGGKAVRALVRKGEKTLHENQDTVDDLKRKARDLGDKVMDAVEKATAKPESPEEAAPVDASAMSPEERAELRRQLDEADQADAACEVDASCEPDAACEADAACEPCEPAPVAPDVIYRTEAPVPEEPADAPEESPNG